MAACKPLCHNCCALFDLLFAFDLGCCMCSLLLPAYESLCLCSNVLSGQCVRTLSLSRGRWMWMHPVYSPIHSTQLWVSSFGCEVVLGCAFSRALDVMRAAAPVLLGGMRLRANGFAQAAVPLIKGHAKATSCCCICSASLQNSVCA